MERRGVDSEGRGAAGGLWASRLHTGQNVRHVVSHESTHCAWNSVMKRESER